MKLSYDTAKRLKDAGFPQKTHNECCGEVLGEDGEPVMIPDLSELIEACGDEIYSLRRTYEKNIWVAHGYNLFNRDIKQIQFQALGQKGFVGSTPEEAVANLYLALHEKETK